MVIMRKRKRTHKTGGATHGVNDIQTAGNSNAGF